jgi:hypothetical protein
VTLDAAGWTRDSVNNLRKHGIFDSEKFRGFPRKSMNLGKVLARAVLLNRPELADLVNIYPLRLRHNFNRATPSDPAFSELYKVKRTFTASEWVRLENEGKKAPEFYDKDKRPIYALKMQAVLKNSKKRFMLFDIMRNLGKERHSNVLFVDKATRSAELFEPHGINFRNGHDMYAVIFEALRSFSRRTV